jgi:hypothetical protein
MAASSVAMLRQSETVADDYLCEVEYPLEQRDDEWEYRAFNADRSVNVLENLDRCFACHKLQARQDFVHTLDLMKNAN